MDLTTFLPDYYKGNSTMEELQSILTNDINNLLCDLTETVDECFVNTASILLSRYEKIYGLEVNVSKSDSFRRERIKAKVVGIGTVTKQMIVDTAASFSNGEVEVSEDPENYKFTIKFIGTRGKPENMGDLTLTIEEIKPAHLAYVFEFVYNTNAELNAFTHTRLSAYTHEQLRDKVMN